MAYTNIVDIEKYNRTFPLRLRGLMDSSSATQAAIAKAIGVTPQAVGAYARGESVPKLEYAQALADFFNVPLDYLTGRTGVKSRNLTTQSIHEVTGLSETAIENLRSLKRTPEAGLSFINSILEDSALLYAFSALITEIVSESEGEQVSGEAYKSNLVRFIECVDILREMVSKMLDNQREV